VVTGSFAYCFELTHVRCRDAVDSPAVQFSFCLPTRRALRPRIAGGINGHSADLYAELRFDLAEVGSRPLSELFHGLVFKDPSVTLASWRLRATLPKL